MAAETKLAALRVSAEMDARGFSAGAAEIEAGSKKAGTAAKQLADELRKTGDAAEQVDTRIRPANDGLEKLKRQFIDGYASAQNLERALNAISRALDKGLPFDQAARMAEAAIRKYGAFANATQFAAKGQIEYAAAIDRANASMVNQQNMRPGVPGMPSAANQNFAAQNTLFQLQDIGVTAAMGMNPLMIALQQGTQISATLGPMGAAGAVEALKAAFVGLVNPVSLVTFGLVAAGAAAIQYLMPLMNQGDDAAEKLERQRDAIDGIVRKWGEATPAFKAYVDERERLANIDQLRTGIEGGQADAWSGVRGQMSAMNDLMSDIFQQAQTAGADTGELLEAQEAWKRLRAEVAGQKATADTARSAQKELLDLFRETGIPAVDEQANTFIALADAISKASAAAATYAKEGGSRISFEQMKNLPGANSRGFLLGDTDRAAELNESLNSQAAAAQEAERRRIEEANRIAGIGMPVPLDRPKNALPTIDSEPERSATAYENLTRAADQRIEQLRNEISLVGQSVDAQARLRAEFEAETQYREQMARANKDVDERELAALREKARLQAQLTQQLAGANFDKAQQDDLRALEQRASVIGLSAEAAARSNAVFQAEQQMRQQGISLLGEEADRRRALASATADYASAIQRSEQAYASLQQAGGSAIDALFASTGSLEDRLKNSASAMLQWITEISLVNPLKNSVLGTNLPTLGDLGRPTSPGGITSTGMMTVTAGTVTVNGGLMSDALRLPGTTTGGGLADVIGYKPATSTASTNPALAGMMNDPSLAARTASTMSLSDRANMWRQSISQMESGSFQGNYNALGPITNSGDRAYGRYQVMGNNVGPWTEKYYGSRLTPDQFRANPAAQDAVFDGEFGSYVSKYGEGPAATKWFTGSPVAKGRQDVLGTTDTGYTSQFNANMQKLSQTTATTTKDIGGLGDSTSKLSTSLTDNLGKLATPTPTVTPPAVTPTATTGSNPFSAIFGGIFKLFGFADGTDFAPGGVAMVGERGPELVNLPRGASVTPTHKLAGLNSEQRQRGGGQSNVDVRVSMDKNGNLQAFVERISEARALATTQAGFAMYDAGLPDRMEYVRQNPDERG